MFTFVIIAFVSMFLNALLNIARYMDECSGYVDSKYKMSFMITQNVISIIGLLSMIFYVSVMR